MSESPEAKSPEEIIVCRCEDVTLARIQELIREGVHTVDEIKRLTRAGMGLCQGRTCRHLVMQEISGMTGVPIDQLLMPTFRPPSRPVKLGLIAAAADERSGSDTDS